MYAACGTGGTSTGKVESFMATPHISAQAGAFAKTVLMPGDPLRARFIAQEFLENPKLVTQVRGMLGYTGTYQGIPVSVMGSGMGMPSMGIYSYELFTQYDVENIVRVGSAGAYSDQAELFSVLLVTQAYSESTFAKTQNGCTQSVLKASEPLNRRIKESAHMLQKPLLEGMVHSTDVFYRETQADYWKDLRDGKGCLAVEMESFALFHNAQATGRQAACLLTISDSFVSQKQTSAQERETGFTDMIKIALESLVI